MECTICNKYFCTTSYGCTVCTSDLKVMLSFGFTRDDLIMINKGLVVPHNIIEKLLLNVNTLCEGSTIFKYLLNPDIRELDDIKCKICNKHVNFTKNDEYGKIEIYTGVSEYCAICTSDLQIMLSSDFTRDDLVMINKGLWISNNITQKLLPIVSNLCDGSVLFKYLLDHNIKDLYDLYCKERHLKSKIINISEYNYLKKILNNKKSGEIVAILYGLTGFPRYILPASYIIDLINQCAIYVASEDMWKYIHAIMPFTLDLHNIDYGNHHIIECYYYRHKGNVPTSCSSLFNVWEYLHSNCHKKSTDKYKVDECYICFDDLCITQELYQCKQCEKILHKNCFKKYWKTSNKQNCPHCQKNLNLLRIGLNNTQDIAII